MPTSPAASTAPDPPPELNLTHNTGDFTLISSDNVEFRIDSFHLFAASAVFRNAAQLDNGGAKVVHLTGDFESSETVDRFLTLIKDHCLHEIEADLDGCKPLFDLVQFIRKYECRETLTDLLNAFHRQYLSDPYDNYVSTGLVLGAIADEPEFCSQAISMYELHERFHDPKKQHKESNDLLPVSLPFEVVQLMPPVYCWALARSWIDSKYDLEKWAYEFPPCLDKASRPPQPAAPSTA